MRQGLVLYFVNGVDSAQLHTVAETHKTFRMYAPIKLCVHHRRLQADLDMHSHSRNHQLIHSITDSSHGRSISYCRRPDL